MNTFTIELENGFIIPSFASTYVIDANTADERHIQPADCDTAACAFYQAHGYDFLITSVSRNS